MAGKADFQPLVDWVQQTPPSYFVKYAVGCRVEKIFEVDPLEEALFHGVLDYHPARGHGQWYPEHFQGSLPLVSLVPGSTSAVYMAMAVHDRGAVFELTGTARSRVGWEEHDVEDPVDWDQGVLSFRAPYLSVLMYGVLVATG